MKRVLLIDPFSGASGDMLLSSVISAGVSFDDIRERLHAMPVLGGVTIRVEPVRRGMFEAVRLAVDMPHEHAHRSLSTIRTMIEESALAEAVKGKALEAFTALAGAEATVHGCEADTVTFHEVGALDSILDIVGWYSAMDILGWPHCYYTRLALGSGSVRSAHGDIPLPAPATMELLKEHPVSFTDERGELITPTAAAIIAVGFQPLSSSRVFTASSIGYGAGTRDTREGLPNILRTMLGSVRESPAQVCIITCTIDDMNPQLYGYMMEKLFARGALEVYFNAVMMKKNRPGLEMTVITEEKDVQETAALILSETTTIGLRVSREERIELPRERADVETPYGVIAVKIVTLPGGVRRMSPEYESCRAAAEKANVRILDVFDAVRAAWKNERT